MSLTIKLLISDVDGVMTDGGVYYTESGERLKKFNVHDTMGFSHLKTQGIQPAIVFAGHSPTVQLIAEDAGIDHWYQDVQDKFQLAKDLCSQQGIQLENVAFIGDDTNDLELMKNVGIAACPVDAPKSIQKVNDILVLKRRGGRGVVREFIDYLLENGFH